MPHALGNAIPSAEVLRERDERLQSLDQLVSHLAHDFNNSLVPLTGYVTLLKEEIKPATVSNEYLGKLEACVHKTEALIEVLLESTHPERRYSPRRIDLAALVRRTADSWRRSVSAAKDISIEIDVTACTLWLDEQFWTKVIEHLLSNAHLALGVGGTIKLSLQRRELTSGEAAGLGFADTNTFELACEDTGMGMSDETLKRAFDPLFTTRPGATGLGLTLTHGVVRLHGGQLALESVEDLGTRVTIWLPASGA